MRQNAEKKEKYSTNCFLWHDMEKIQMYLLGCRHMWEVMELLGIRKDKHL